jgi:hypothetical protein
MELLYLQHLTETVSFMAELLQSIDDAYTAHTGKIAETKAKAREEAAAVNAGRGRNAAPNQTSADASAATDTEGQKKKVQIMVGHEHQSTNTLAKSAEPHHEDGDNAIASSANEKEADKDGEFAVADVPSLPLKLVRAAIAKVDEHKPRADVNRLLAYCCKLTIEEMLLLEARRTPFSIADIKRRLRMKVVRKSPPNK